MFSTVISKRAIRAVQRAGQPILAYRLPEPPLRAFLEKLRNFYKADFVSASQKLGFIDANFKRWVFHAGCGVSAAQKLFFSTDYSYAFWLIMIGKIYFPSSRCEGKSANSANCKEAKCLKWIPENVKSLPLVFVSLVGQTGGILFFLPFLLDEQKKWERNEYL